MRRLLYYIISESVAGRGSLIKSYTVAVDGLGRAEDFDAQQDSYPRVQVGRLRKALEVYYRDNQSVSGIRFELRPGNYEIFFVEAAIADESAGSKNKITEAGLPVIDADVDASEPDPDSIAHSELKKMGVSWLVFGLALVAIALVLMIGMSHHWFTPWGQKDNGAYEISNFPLIDVQRPTVDSNDADANSMANYMQLRITDAIRRGGWVRVKSTYAPHTPLAHDMPANYVLRGKLYREDGQLMLAAELIDNDDALIVWTHNIVMSVHRDAHIDPEERILGSLVNVLVEPGGIIAERELQKQQSVAPLPGYPCLVLAADFKSDRNATAYDQIRSCLQRTLDLKPRLARATALLAELELDNVDFNYASERKSSLRHALKLAVKAVAQDPGDAVARSILALLQFRAGDHGRARVNALKGYELNPYSGLLLARLGNILFFSGDSKGMAMVRHVLEIDNNPAPWSSQPLFFDAVAKGHLKDAVAHVSIIPEIQGTGGIYPLTMRAVAAAMQGKNENARKYWAIVVQHAPQAARDPNYIFERMGVSKPYADKSIDNLRAAGAISQ